LFLIISLLVSILSLVSMVTVIPVAASPTPTLYVDPPNIVDLTMVPPATFSVNVVVKDVTDLAGFQFNLTYKTTVLTATGISLGPFFPPGSWQPAKAIDDTKGLVTNIVFLPLGSKEGLSGSGIVATIKFTVEGSGVSLLDLENTKLGDTTGQHIAHEVIDGYFCNVPLPKVYVDPEDIANPDLVAGNDFTINVKVSDATDLYSYEFFLNYTTTVLTATGIVLGGFFPTGSIVREEINDTVGYVWYNVTMPTGSTSGRNENGTLATVTFNVESIGESRLDLCKTKLVDSMGSVTEHYAVDGSFKNKPNDIVITQVSTSRYVTELGRTYVKGVSEAYAGEPVNVTVLVMNNGTKPESFNVTAYYEDTTIGNEALTDFPAGTSTTLTFEWDTAGVAEGNHTIWAEASAVPGEINTDNNKFTKLDKFRVLGRTLFPIELVVAATVLIIAVATIAVYFLKIRKPKQV